MTDLTAYAELTRLLERAESFSNHIYAAELHTTAADAITHLSAEVERLTVEFEKTSYEANYYLDLYDRISSNMPVASAEAAFARAEAAERQRDEALKALKVISGLDYKQAAVNGAAYDAVKLACITLAHLTEGSDKP